MSHRTGEGEKGYPDERLKGEGEHDHEPDVESKAESSDKSIKNSRILSLKLKQRNLSIGTGNDLKANRPAEDGQQKSIIGSPSTSIGSSSIDSRPVESHQDDERSQKCEEIDLNLPKSDSKSCSQSTKTKSSAKSKKSKPKKGKIDDQQASSSHGFIATPVSDNGGDALKTEKGVEDNLNKTVFKKEISTASTFIESKMSPTEDNSLSKGKKPQVQSKKSKAKRDKNIQMADQGASGSINTISAVTGCEKGKEDNKSVQDGTNQRKILVGSSNTLFESNPDESKPVVSFSDNAANQVEKLSNQCEKLNLNNRQSDLKSVSVLKETKSKKSKRKNNANIQMVDQKATSSRDSLVTSVPEKQKDDGPKASKSAEDGQQEFFIEDEMTPLTGSKKLDLKKERDDGVKTQIREAIESDAIESDLVEYKVKVPDLNNRNEALSKNTKSITASRKTDKENRKINKMAHGQASSSSNSSSTSEADKVKSDALKANKHSAEFALSRVSLRYLDKIPFRPKMENGGIGIKTKLKTNFFRLPIKDNAVYRYHVNFSRPNNENAVAEEREIGPRFRRVTKKMHQNLLHGFVHTVGQNLFIGTIYCFDGDHVMITNNKLNIPDDGQEFLFNFAENEPIDGPRNLEPYVIRIQPVQSGHLGVDRVDINLSESNRDALQMLDIITKKDAFENLIVYKSKIFFPESSTRFPRIGIKNSPFEIAFGYHHSTRICQGGLMQNIDRATAILFRGGPLVDRIGDLIGHDNLNKQLKQYSIEMLRELLSLKVQTNHLGSTRTYTIRSFSDTPCNRTYFTVGAVRMSIAEYFRDTYQINLCYPNLPCVVYSPRKYLPIEICELVPHQRYQRKLKEDLIRELTLHSTKQNPRDRLKLSVETAKTISKQDSLKRFGIKLKSVPVEVEGRIIPSPLLKYANADRFEVPKHLGVWNMAEPDMKQFLNSARLERWIMIAVDANRCIDDIVARRLFLKLRETGDKIGLNISPPLEPFLSITHDDLKNKFARFLELDLQLIVCIANERSYIYNKIKSLGDCLIGVPTQVINDKNYNPKGSRLQKIFTDAYIFNLLLKINKKIGGVNVGLSENPNLLNGQTMVVGIDVNHPSPGDDSPSLAAVVGSLDRYFSNYFTEMRINNSRLEFVDVASMMRPILEEFRAKNSSYPVKIIIYRDGVSEGMFADVVTEEIEPLCEYLSTLGPNPPKLTYIIVQKRHSTRLFPAYERKDTKPRNILPGSVVDTEICHYKWFDFYICSQNSSLGTARPNKYTVLWDETQSNADDLQIATYHLCYLFARATKSISDPAPARLAHLAAARGKAYLSTVLTDEPELRNNTLELTRRVSFNEQLKDKLFFI